MGACHSWVFFRLYTIGMDNIKLASPEIGFFGGLGSCFKVFSKLRRKCASGESMVDGAAILYKAKQACLEYPM